MGKRIIFTWKFQETDKEGKETKEEIETRRNKKGIKKRERKTEINEASHKEKD